MPNNKLEYTLSLSNKAFINAMKKAGVETGDLEKELKILDEQGKKTTKSLTAGFANFTTGVNQGLEIVSKLIQTTKGLAGVALDYDKNLTLVQKRLNLTNEEAESFLITSQALAETLETADFNNIVDASNALRNEFKDLENSGTKALDFIGTLFEKAPDKAGEFLQQIKEYSSQFSQLGANAETFAIVINEAVQAGTYDDKVIDSIKEFRFTLSDLSKDAKQSLADIGVNSDKLVGQIDSGAITAYDALLQVSKALSDVGVASGKGLKAVSKVFVGAGEDAGRFIAKLNELPESLDNVESQISESQKAQLEWNKLTVKFSAILAQKVLPVLNDITKWATDNQEEIEQGIGGLVDLAENAVGAINVILGGVRSFSVSIAKGLNEDLLLQKYLSEQALKEAQANLKKATGENNSFFSQSFSDATEFFTNFKEGATSAIDQVVAKFTEAHKKNLAQNKEQVDKDKRLEAIKKFATSAKREIEDYSDFEISKKIDTNEVVVGLEQVKAKSISEVLQESRTAQIEQFREDNELTVAVIENSIGQTGQLFQNFFDSIVDGGASGTEILEQFGKALLKSTVGVMIDIGVQTLKNKVISEIATAGSVATQVAAATAISAAYLPAATLAAIATGGGSAVSASGAIASTFALTKGLSIAGNFLEDGGDIIRAGQGAILGGNRHSQGGNKFAFQDGTRGEAEKGELVHVFSRAQTQAIQAGAPMGQFLGKFQNGGSITNNNITNNTPPVESGSINLVLDGQVVASIVNTFNNNSVEVGEVIDINS